MAHHLQHIANLIEIFKLKRFRQVVVSPGSRNAPLIKGFASDDFFSLHSIVDERSAGFFALGLSLATHEPVILLCTSGSAVLNYSPALSEAFYRHIPLVALTADRPEELIDQQDNQTIRQQRVYNNFIKASLHLVRPGTEKYDSSKQNEAISAIIRQAILDIPGPVHLNVPISEPLYGPLPVPDVMDQDLFACTVQSENPINHKIQQAWANMPKRMILCGQQILDPRLNSILGKIALSKYAVVLAEPIANVKGELIIRPVEPIMMRMGERQDEIREPDLLISFGGQVVSKKLKKWLQQKPDLVHFRLSPVDEHIDTYGNLSETIVGNPFDILSGLMDTPAETDHDFFAYWQTLALESRNLFDQIAEKPRFSDLWVFNQLVRIFPENSILHLGNSSVVRYAQHYGLNQCDEVYANRGVSGIDGCLSTAVGFAKASTKLNLVILGDLSFVYDSNGLWNKNLPHNLKIIVINNQGGGIFRLLPGASHQSGFEEYVEAHHPVSIGKLAEAFHVTYTCIEDLNNFKLLVNEFFRNNQGPALLEIKTPGSENAVEYTRMLNEMKERTI